MIDCSSEKRIEWVDMVKAIGIILVLVGHSDWKETHSYIYAFHMPLFYIISGFLWNTKKYLEMPFGIFLKKKFKSYIIPYLKISAICFVLYGIGLNLLFMGLSKEYGIQLLKYLFGIFIYSRGTMEWLPNCSPIWFLTALFFAEMFFYWVMRSRNMFFWVVLLGFVGYACSGVVKLPWNIDNACTAVVLLYSGWLIRRYWCYVSSEKVTVILLPISICALVWGVKGTDFDGNTFICLPATYLQSIMISMSLLTITSRFVSHLKPNSIIHVGGGKIGKNTLLLMGYNYMLNTIISRLPVSYGWVSAIYIVILSIILVLLVEKYFKIKQIVI